MGFTSAPPTNWMMSASSTLSARAIPQSANSRYSRSLICEFTNTLSCFPFTRCGFSLDLRGNNFGGIFQYPSGFSDTNFHQPSQWVLEVLSVIIHPEHTLRRFRLDRI